MNKRFLPWLMAATLTLSGCDMINSLLGNEPPKTNISPLNAWILGSVPNENSSQTFQFEVVPGHTYYLNWDDEYTGSGNYEGDVLVTVKNAGGNVLLDQWGIPLDGTADQYDGGDNGWVGQQNGSNSDYGQNNVDFTRLISVSTGTAMVVTAVPYDGTGTGQFRLRLRSSAPTEPAYDPNSPGTNAQDYGVPVAGSVAPSGPSPLSRTAAPGPALTRR